eukprot:2978864-Prymnesium_polylepis.1
MRAPRPLTAFRFQCPCAHSIPPTSAHARSEGCPRRAPSSATRAPATSTRPAHRPAGRRVLRSGRFFEAHSGFRAAGTGQGAGR